MAFPRFEPNFFMPPDRPIWIGSFPARERQEAGDPATCQVYKFRGIADFIAFQRAIDYVAAKGILIVAAAGNDAINITNPTTLTQLLNEAFSAYKNAGAPTPNWYSFMSGTSMATPKVAAVGELIIDYAKENGQRLLPAQVVTRLQQSASDLGKKGYDMYYSSGMVNAVSALSRK
jgi:subtilisin family serine protease